MLPIVLALQAFAAEPPRFVLLTMDAGDDPFSKAGHAALCAMLPDVSPGRSPCFNYGITSFEDPPKLLWDYARGDADFWVEEWTYGFLMRRYTKDYDRTVWTEDVPLTHGAADALLTLLRNDAKPENSHYEYHHFYDNCTTRVRDRIDVATGGALRKDADGAYPKSWRDFAEESLEGEPVLLAASAFAGRAADVHPTLWQAMARPEILREEVAKRLGVPVRQAYTRRASLPTGSRYAGRALIAAVAVAVTAVLQLASRRRPRTAWRVAPLLPGLLGAVLWLAAVLSVQAEARVNEALLLFVPTDLLLLWPRSDRYRSRYLAARLAVVATALVLDLVGALEQPLFTLVTLLLPMAVAWGPAPARKRATVPDPSSEGLVTSK